MLYKRNAIINTKQELVTNKCFPIRYRIPIWYIESYLKDKLSGVFNYFTKSSCSVDIKEDKVSIYLDAGEWHKVNCQYIAINNIPMLFIISEENPKTINFFRKQAVYMANITDPAIK